jgi:hypothetical protein
MVFGSMIFSVISRMTSGILGIALMAATSTSEFAQDDAFHYNRLLGRGINLVTALDGPQESLGCHARGRLFRLIKEAGFNSVRIPIDWSAHSEAAQEPDVRAAERATRPARRRALGVHRLKVYSVFARIANAVRTRAPQAN